MQPMTHRSATRRSATHRSVKDKTIIITGAASGLGRTWALAFAEEGADVVAADINEKDLATLPAQGIRHITTDVTSTEQLQQMIEFAVSPHQRIDILFNNAGTAFGHTLESAANGLFEKHIAIHLFACANAMRLVIPIMRSQGYGRIINTISRNAEFSMPTTSAYAAAKAAMWATSRVTAAEVSDQDILVNMLIPGPTNTAIWGREMTHLQHPDATIATARMLATLPADGPSGRVFWDEKEYDLFNPDNKPGDR
ncbi:MAG TPA: SDR family oxidoreductase [Gammaproteobacteria bacterium]|nr:SDR family oxidoreductase [Gammaproteobacteria bacterium]HIK70428.1 SDR family oxidoreductase [Pseudomonadales bacterium]